MTDGDLHYLNDIHDAQMFHRAPRRKFERLDLSEYYVDAEFEDRFRFTKEEMRSDKFTLIHVRLSQCWTEKTIKNAKTINILTYHAYIATGKESRFIQQKCVTLMHLAMFSPRGGAGDTLGIRPTKSTFPGNLSEHFETGTGL